MIHQRIPLGLYQAPESLPKGSAEGVFIINLENIDIDQVVAMRLHLKTHQHQLVAGNPSVSSRTTHEH